MLKNRLIPVVLLRNGVVVQSKHFRRYQLLGSPTTIVERLSAWASDELIYLDISRDSKYDLGRDDLKMDNPDSPLAILAAVSKCSFMPLSIGGGIRTLAQVAARLRAGADKVTLNTAALANPAFIGACAKEFGSQCIIVSIDAKRDEKGIWKVHKGGHEPVDLDALTWCSRAEDMGAGELLINSIDRDGTGAGYDIPLIQAVVATVSIPVIALGGVGRWEHFVEGLAAGGASAVAAANIFNYSENSVYNAKRHLFDAGLNVREPCLGFSS